MSSSHNESKHSSQEAVKRAIEGAPGATTKDIAQVARIAHSTAAKALDELCHGSYAV